MKFNATDGKLGEYLVGMQLSVGAISDGELTEPATRRLGKNGWVYRFLLASGETLFVTDEHVVDAVGVVKPYSNQVLEQVCLGDPVSLLFLERSHRPVFPATFVEYVEHIFYFTTEQQFGISVHIEGIPFEDGPFNEHQWQRILDGKIKSVFVCRNNHKQLAY